MLAQKDVAALPSAEEPLLVLDDPAKRNAVEQAYSRIAPTFWGRVSRSTTPAGR